MAVKEVLVPDIGDFKDIEVIEVLVKPGDVINTDDSLITLESDKAAMEVPAPFSGVVKSVKVKPGDRVSLGSLILNLEVEEAKAATPEKVQETAKPLEVSQSIPETQPPAAVPEVSAPQSGGEPSVQELYVPDIGDYKDIEVIEVLVKPGDEVSADDSLITLESDKAAMEVPSPLSGIIKSVNLKTGDRVSKGAVIALIETRTGAVPAAKAPVTSAQESPASAPAPAPAQTALPVAPNLAEAAPLDGGLSHASPGIRRLARELGVNLAKVRGTGPKNRILKEDVQQFVKTALTQLEKPAASNGGFGFPPLPEVDFSKYGPIEELPLTRIQKLSGPNLHRNWVSIPHITQYDDADITDLEAFRVSLKSEAEKRGVKLSFLPFVLKAVAASLKAFPTFNASLSPHGETLILKHYVHIGVAVDTPEGLVVPVIRDVDQKSLFDLAQELAELSQKARSKKLRSQDLEGGCFSISSLGGIGGTAFTPIINAPQVAILGLSKNQMKPVYQNGQFVPRLMLPLSLSYDHRVIDGAEAARFIVHLSRVLSDLRRVLL